MTLLDWAWLIGCCSLPPLTVYLFDLATRAWDRLKCWHWRNDQTGYDMKRVLKYGLRRGLIDREWNTRHDRFPKRSEL